MPLSLHNLGKSYRLYASERARLWELLTGRPRHTCHWALQGVDLDAQAGESIGIIGDNGAGKSTLLKLVAGSLSPTTGEVRRQGRVTAILELGTGFHPEFTGEENLYYAGALMDIEAREMRRLYPSIVDFAELEAVMGQPLKTYSTGMVMRLAFALVTAVEPELLIVDEALAVGDRHFQKKCIERMREIRDGGATILFCSHSMHHIMQFCDRALWLKAGRVEQLGGAEEVVNRYVAESLGQEKKTGFTTAEAESFRSPGATSTVLGLELLTPTKLRRGERIELHIEVVIEQEGDYVFGAALDRVDNQVRMVAETGLENGIPPWHLEPGRYRVAMSIGTLCLRAGRYLVYAGLLDGSLLQVEDYRTREVEIQDRHVVRSPAMMRGDWTCGAVEALR
jgi:homopolymeric O-antigen transport system ATP-binding protein